MVVDQAISQTIVFSFIQKKKNTLANVFIPNILISRNEFRIIMYDAENDILICSEPLYIFTSSSLLSKSTVIILWMVLNYGLFLEKEKSLFKEISRTAKKFDYLKADFEEMAKHSLKHYKDDLKIGEANFPVVRIKPFPSLSDLSGSLDVFSTK